MGENDVSRASRFVFFVDSVCVCMLTLEFFRRFRFLASKRKLMRQCSRDVRCRQRRELLCKLYRRCRQRRTCWVCGPFVCSRLFVCAGGRVPPSGCVAKTCHRCTLSDRRGTHLRLHGFLFKARVRLPSILIKDGESRVHALGTLSTPRHTWSLSPESRISVKSTQGKLLVGTVRSASAADKILKRVRWVPW